jgi:Tfp pilus assembly protein PilV
MNRSHHDKNLKKQKSQQGFTLMEATVSMFLLSFAILLNLPLLVVLQNENTTSKVRLGASSLARDVLNDIRAQRVVAPVDGDFESEIPKLGYEYDVTTYICTSEPVVDPETFAVTGCSTADDIEDRHIVIQIKRNGQTEPIHTVQTFFTRVVPPPAAN